ncbi:hypothetical protein [Roseivirga pacifica]|uniref:hypothetical protein n=1 Tax=Roseivirga pacifica TaxID=1267423 RepID=UPI003BB13A8E
MFKLTTIIFLTVGINSFAQNSSRKIEWYSNTIEYKNHNDFIENTLQIPFERLSQQQKAETKLAIQIIQEALTSEHYSELINQTITSPCIELSRNQEELINRIFKTPLLESKDFKKLEDHIIFIDKHTKQFSAIGIELISETKDEFGTSLATELYIFQRFSDGLKLSSVICAG